MTLEACKQFALLLLTIAPILISEVLPYDNVGNRLIREVFKGYQRDVRPMCGLHPRNIDLTLGIAIRQLIEVNNPEQKLTTSIWFRMVWHDCRIHWEPSDYKGLLRVIVPTSLVWVPDLTLYENAESKLGEQDQYLVAVGHTGHIMYNLPAVVKSMCKLNVAMFPFDHQTCYLTLGSWIYGDHEVNFTATSDNTADLRSYIPHGEWDLWKLDAEEYTLLGYDNVGYAQVIFTIHLRRKSLFHTINLILPSIIVKSIAIIGFLLPPESGEKLNLEITVLLSLLVFQLVILNNMPHSSENMPVIAIFFLLSMIMIALSCLCTVVILNVHFKKHSIPLPTWMRQIVTGRVGWLFRLDELMTHTHEKLQNLRNEHTQNRYKQKFSSESNSNAWTQFPRKASGTPSNGLGRFALSLRPRKSKDLKDDSVYGFNPSSGYSYTPTDPGGFSSQVLPEADRSSTSFFSLNVNELVRNASEPHTEDTTAQSASEGWEVRESRASSSQLVKDRRCRESRASSSQLVKGRRCRESRASSSQLVKDRRCRESRASSSQLVKDGRCRESRASSSQLVKDRRCRESRASSSQLVKDGRCRESRASSSQLVKDGRCRESRASSSQLVKDRRCRESRASSSQLVKDGRCRESRASSSQLVKDRRCRESRASSSQLVKDRRCRESRASSSQLVKDRKCRESRASSSQLVKDRRCRESRASSSHFLRDRRMVTRLAPPQEATEYAIMLLINVINHDINSSKAMRVYKVVWQDEDPGVTLAPTILQLASGPINYMTLLMKKHAASTTT
ncbi:hypothetical protein RRG08_045887 [Elysia crispata]|uniref:Uncharacterized protein n=1 Tax=Elysia crispata TaxID=231223 RepID=A0AAE0ZER6_9GAST|nr:hypothetical protein RRG08_045887 [Elysia crispata]